MAPEGEILQLTCADLNTSEIVFSSYIKPKGKISKDAENVHGISLKMVENEPVFAEKANEIERLFKKYKNPIAYNTPFDGKMLGIEFNRAGLKLYFDLENTNLCAMHRSAEIFQEWNDYRNSYKWQKLAEMGKFLKLEWQGIAHDASADVLMTIDVIHAIAELPFRTK